MNKRMNVRGKKILVVGMARSGVAAARLLVQMGADITLYDAKSREQLKDALLLLEDFNYHDAIGGDPMALLDNCDGIVLSPGVPPSLPFIVQAIEMGIEVISEIELGYRVAGAPIIAIGGTNGKTTTTALTGELFKAAGKHTYILGNIGLPLTEKAGSTNDQDIIVAEIASLQLETSVDFRPHSCVLLNITEDHLDRFKTMEYYIDVKCKMFNNQTKLDFAVLNADDPISSGLADRIQSRLLWFSRLHEVDEGAFVRDGKIVFRMDSRESIVCDVNELKIPGTHNLENALAAVAVSMPVGVDALSAAKALRTFSGVEHRIEFVCESNGVQYINDSKATNPDSTIKAVQAMDRPTVLMMGGSNKNSDYCPVFRAFNGKIKAVVALGETLDQIVRDAKKTGYESIYVCSGTFEEAVMIAQQLAAPGDNILLSPACASYDMFDNYEQRGRVFKQIVTRY